MKTVTLTIDGKTITAPEGSTVLEAARSADIDIPTLCYDERMEPYGACRLCIVEVEGMRGLPTSCTTTVAEGMVVHTETETVSQVRRLTCEMLIADHPSDCLACSSNQRCQLQKVASRLGITEKRLKPMERESVLDESNPFYTRDLAKCILCGLCVRVCDEVRGVTAIGIAGRGYESRIAAFGDDGIDHSTCESCGACVDICPVDALRPKHETLPPDKTVNTICPYCGCGCELEVGVRANKIVRVQGAKDCPVNWGQLCVKGRFGLDFVNAPDRLTTPLIKRDGKFEEASWDEALDLVASKMAEIKEKHGADALAGFASAKCTNEENYVFQKVMRAAVGTNNVDHCARLCHASTVAGLALAFGSGAMTNSIEEFEHADCIFVTGSNTTEAHPIIALRIKAAVERHGAQLIVADPRAIDLTRFASQHVRQRCGSDVALFNAMIHVIIGEGLADKEFISTRTEGFDKLAKSVETCTAEWAAAITGIDAEDIRKLARTYAQAKSASIVYSMGITQHTTGTDNVLAVANLAMLTGNIGRLSTGVNPLRGQNNVQGACDLGALPNVYPGYQPVTDADLQKKFEEAWGVSLSGDLGLPVTEAINAAADGRLKGIYIMGENPMVSDPNLNHAREAIENLEFLCVQDIFMTETAQMADVVLPAASFAEKDGTFTNTERRVQRVRAALDMPGEARQDWDIASEIATRLGYEMHYESAEEILAEIASVTPILAGINFDRIDKIGIPWPCPTTDHPGTPFLHEGEFKRGLGKFHPTLFREPAELPDDEYPLILTTGRVLYHFHTGTMSRRSPGLEEISPPTPFEINPADAAELGIAEGDTAELSSRRGTVRAQALVTERAPRGTVFMPFHFSEAAANTLTNDALDPIAKIPEFKVCAVRVDAVPQPAPVTASAREDS